MMERSGKPKTRKEYFYKQQKRGEADNAPSRFAKGVRLSSDQVIFGFHAAEAALLNERRIIRHAYGTENALAKVEPILLRRVIAFTLLAAPDLDALLGEGAVHQGIALHIEPLEQPSLEEFLDQISGKQAIVAMLDQVTDPHNVGAVLRSAAAFGIGGLIVQARHSPPLSAALAKAASGGLEHVPVIETVNLARSLQALKEHDFECIGFDSDADAAFTSAVTISPRSCFVFGAEDKGLRRLVRESCDRVLALAAPGPIKSLNVSNAAAIVFHAAAQTRK